MQAEFSPDGRLVLAVLAGEEILLFDARHGRVVARWRSPSRVSIARFAPDRPRVVTGNMEGDIEVWDVAPVLASLR